LINVTSDRILRFMPPLIVGEEEIDRLVEALERVLTTGSPTIAHPPHPSPSPSGGEG
jgi:acetylornithine/succinyldiaminopimelate/putrescine aminotransferase